MTFVVRRPLLVASFESGVYGLVSHPELQSSSEQPARRPSRSLAVALGTHTHEDSRQFVHVEDGETVMLMGRQASELAHK